MLTTMSPVPVQREDTRTWIFKPTREREVKTAALLNTAKPTKGRFVGAQSRFLNASQNEALTSRSRTGPREHDTTWRFYWYVVTVFERKILITTPGYQTFVVVRFRSYEEALSVQQLR